MSSVSPLQGKLGRVVSTFGRRGRTGGVGQEGGGGASFDEGGVAELAEGDGAQGEDKGAGEEVEEDGC